MARSRAAIASHFANPRGGCLSFSRPSVEDFRWGEPCAAGTAGGYGGSRADGWAPPGWCPAMRPLPTFHCPFTKLAPDLANSVACSYCWARGSIAGFNQDHAGHP
jgi:hypothetical protein